MGVMSWHGLSHVVIVILFEVKVSTQFAQDLQPACHSTDTCGTAQLSCNAGQRLAILNVRHGHHVNITQFDVCPVQVSNCSQVPADCCLVGTTSEPDCFEPYNQTILVDVHRKCSGITSPNSGGNFTCDVQLPPVPQAASGSCAKASHQSLSSYSLVDYACVNDADISSLCAASEKTGSLLYVMWTQDNLPTLENGQNNVTCKCRVTSSVASSVNAFVRTLDIRLPKPGTGGICSSVSVVDSRTTHFETPCDDEGVFLFDPGFQQNDRIQPATPFDVIFSLHVQHVPEMVWLGFTGSGNENLKLTCYGPNEDIGVLEPPGVSDSTADGNDDEYTSSERAALIGGIVGGVVVIVILTFVCLHFYSKRKTDTKDSSERKRDDWWERTRQEDRIAELSQLGPASAVVIDDRRNMGYGKHRPTRVRYRYTPSDLNASIVVVPGSAVRRTPGVQIRELNDDDNDNNNSSGNNNVGRSCIGGGTSTRSESEASPSAENRHQRHDVTNRHYEHAPEAHHLRDDVTGNGRYVNTGVTLSDEINGIDRKEHYVNISANDDGNERHANATAALSNDNQHSARGDNPYANDLSTNQSSNLHANDPYTNQSSDASRNVTGNERYANSATTVSHDVTPSNLQQTQEPEKDKEMEQRDKGTGRQEALAAIRRARERKEQEAAGREPAYITSVRVGGGREPDDHKRRAREKKETGTGVKLPAFITSVQVHREGDPDEPTVSYIRFDETDEDSSNTDQWF